MSRVLISQTGPPLGLGETSSRTESPVFSICAINRGAQTASHFVPRRLPPGLLGADQEIDACLMSTAATIDEADSNYQTFRDCVFAAIIDKSSGAKTSRKSGVRRRQSQPSANSTTTSSGDAPVADPSELAEFSDYLSTEIFPSLPEDLRTITYATLKNGGPTTETYSLPLTLTTLEQLTSHLPPSVADTLESYSLINPPASDTTTFLSPILTAYISSATTQPTAPSATRTDHCELCERDWIPLTYHHLIPRSTHARVLKRGWHPEADLQNVAWLCRACHSFVHRTIGNEELAKGWFTVERLAGREDVQKWCKWVGGIRWKKR